LAPHGCGAVAQHGTVRRIRVVAGTPGRNRPREAVEVRWERVPKSDRFGAFHLGVAGGDQRAQLADISVGG